MLYPPPVVARAGLCLLLAPVLQACYLWNQAVGQIRIACASRPIERVLAAADLTDAQKERIRRIQEMREFARSRLDLDPGKAYTKYYDPGGPYISWVVSAAKPDRLEPVQWCFPFVGRVTYKGFFDRADAEKEAQRWRDRGYDVYVRGISAYSTLGWFSDPILPWMLDEPEGSLADTIFHELAHARIYRRGHTEFNESLASFAGMRGATEWLRARYGPDSPQEREYRMLQVDRSRADAFFLDLKRRLEEAYAGISDEEGRLRRKEEILEDARRRFREIPWHDPDVARVAEREWNHAFVLARATYARYDSFEALFEGVGGDWPAFWAAAAQAARSEDPWKAIAERCGNSR